MVKPNMNTNIWIKRNIEQFNFTYAMPEGAWLKTRDFDGMGARDTEWFSASNIDKILGKGEFKRLLSKQGWMTGCWIKI